MYLQDKPVFLPLPAWALLHQPPFLTVQQLVGRRHWDSGNAMGAGLKLGGQTVAEFGWSRAGWKLKGRIETAASIRFSSGEQLWRWTGRLFRCCCHLAGLSLLNLLLFLGPWRVNLDDRLHYHSRLHRLRVEIRLGFQLCIAGLRRCVLGGDRREVFAGVAAQ